MDLKHKWRLTIILVLCTGLMPVFSMNNYDEGVDKIEKITNGYVNWTKGYIEVSGHENLPTEPKNIHREKLQAESSALDKAHINLYQAILNIPIDEYQYFSDFYEAYPDLRARFNNYILGYSKLSQLFYLQVDKVQVSVTYPLYGKGSIGQIIMELDDRIYDPYEELRATTYRQLIPKFKQGNPFSEIIVDVRDLNFRASLFPIIYEGNSNVTGKAIYRPQAIAAKERNEVKYANYVKDNNYIRNKVQALYKNYLESLYDRDLRSVVNDLHLNLKYLFTRTRDELIELILDYDPFGINNEHFRKNHRFPLFIAAQKIIGENNTNIVINKEDVAKILAINDNVDLLKKGKVIILTD